MPDQPTDAGRDRETAVTQCPVCGQFEDDGFESFDICPCCKTEWGYDNATLTIGELRAKWLDGIKAAARREGQAHLDRARATMIRALDALESDADLNARREAFEMIQEQFEDVSHEDHARAEALIPSLRAREPREEPSR